MIRSSRFQVSSRYVTDAILYLHWTLVNELPFGGVGESGRRFPNRIIHI